MLDTRLSVSCTAVCAWTAVCSREWAMMGMYGSAGARGHASTTVRVTDRAKGYLGMDIALRVKGWKFAARWVGSGEWGGGVPFRTVFIFNFSTNISMFSPLSRQGSRVD